MGNNNSSYGNGHISSKSPRHLPHDYNHHHRGKWGASNSDLGDSSGNRMKKGYLPTRGYHGHSRLPSPHKVLPSVNPTSAAKLLKPTSNGAILHQGGTISGRKLLSELDPHSPEAEDLRRAMRKRSTASCPGNGDMLNPASGRSTPNLSVMDYNGGMMMERNGPRRASSKGGSSSRDYDSEPDLRDIDENTHHNNYHHQQHRDDSSPHRSISPVPNSFTLIQESPAKKQIRTKKKGKAPAPPISPGEPFLHHRLGGGDMSCCSPHSPQMLSPCGDGKKGSRLFKTKAESRLAAVGPRSPEICSDLEMGRGGVMRASMDANRFFRGERDRSSLHCAVEAGLCSSKSSSVDHGNLHLSNRKHSEGGGGPLAARKTSLGSTTAMLVGNSNRQAARNGASGLSSRNNPEVKSMMMTPLARDHASASSSVLTQITTSGGANHSSNSSSSTNNHGGGGNRPTGTSNNGNSTGGSSNIISLINQSGIAAATKDEHVPKSHCVSSSANLLPPIAQYGQSSTSSSNHASSSNNISGNSGKPSVNQKVSNKAFISSSFSPSKSAGSQQQLQTSNNANSSKPMVSNGKVGGAGGGKITATSTNNVHHGRRKTTNAPAAPTSTVTTNSNANNNMKNESGNKTMFYFGMDAQQPSSNNGNNSGGKSNKPIHQTATTTVTVHQQSDSDNNNNDCRLTTSKVGNSDKILMNGINHHNHLHEKVSSSNSSELLQIKQDSGSFDTSERAIIPTRNVNGKDLQRESSSELSSSSCDLDIPLNIRPTLPAKKNCLPRFSPTAAWRALGENRALDSPSRVSVSGRSYSSEEGYGHDRIQRYMRQIPPSRPSNHERSAGDSGISAGDAGSPANPEAVPDAAVPIPPNVNPPIMTNGNGVAKGYKLRERNGPPSGKHSNNHNGLRDVAGNKCWTPEQDLDESSSSEYEDQQMSPPHHPPPHPLHHSSSNVATRVLPAGLGTPPKLTTRNNLFERGRSSALGMVSDSDQCQVDKPGNLYVRSRKAMNTGSGVNGGGGVVGQQQSHEDMKKGGGGVSVVGSGGASRYYRNLRSQPWRQTNHLRHASGNNNNNNNANGSRDFVGLDTNWFLSRSEPNSLNLIGNGIGNGEYDNIEQQELRMMLAEQDDDDEDVEEELFLPDEDTHKNQRQLAMMNMHGGGGATNVVVSNEYDEVDGGARLESEIGYGPSSMSLPSPSAVKINSRSKVRQQLASAAPHLSEEFERDQDIEMASPSGGGGTSNVRYGDGSWERRPFSHIMYLPAYDSRRASSSGARRTKSVDNLNFSEMTLYQPRKTSQYSNPISPNVEGVNKPRQQRRSRSPSEQNGRGRRVINRGEPPEPFERSQSVPPFTAEEENERRRMIQMEQQSSKLHQQRERELAAEREREQKKKKFKFQSTLRVMERRKIEEQLSREAEEKERRRLQEQEQMRKVEEEFQKKRVREKVLELEAAAASANKANANKNGHNMDKIEMSNRYDVNFEPRSNFPGNERDRYLQRGGGGGANSARSSNISYSTTSNNNHPHLMFQRQEPEGAPASVSTGGGDLRKELITASRNRNAFPGAGKSELTQELSEFCTPSGKRQYFDYRRAHDGDGYNLRSGPTTRYYNSSSSSDIFPVTSRRDRKRGGGGSSVISSSKSSVGYLRPTVHPQVVCDIPVKRLPYVVNFSRLSGSNMDLLTDQDRPRSGLGNASVLSDNYRKDWAHHNSKGSSGPARASSVISLHSAPPLSNSENFRHSSVDLTLGGSVLHTPPQSPPQSKYSTSPSASPVSHSRPLSSPEERFHAVHSNGDVPSSKLRPPGITQEMWNGDCITGNKTVVMLNSPSSSSAVMSNGHSPTPYQPAPAPYNRQKSFRPVDFNPAGSGAGGLSPAHAFHHASAKLTAPTPVN